MNRLKLRFFFYIFFTFGLTDFSFGQVRLYSESVKDSFTLFISLPKQYAKHPEQKYSVTYLLDANYFFTRVAKEINKKSASTILVGIGYKDFPEMDSLRNRDYTFPIALPEDSFSISGGAVEFLSFVERTVIPYMDTHYRTDTSNRTIMGHSLGGYFALFALQTELKEQTFYFNHFVAASPSLQYYHQYLLKQFQNITHIDSNRRTLFLSLGAKEDKEDGGTGTENTDNFNAFIKELSKTKFQNIKTTSIIYPRYKHMQTAMPTFLNHNIE